MSEPSFASLSSSLLARKGGARPAMRPQLPGLLPEGGATPASLEDLGWNDMGQEDHPREADVIPLTPAPANPDTAAQARALDEEADAALHGAHDGNDRPEVLRQQDRIARDMAIATARQKTVSETAQPRRNGSRAAFTLRLDAERHLRLRLASTIRNRSAQQIVTEALDALLGAMPELETLAAQVKRH